MKYLGVAPPGAQILQVRRRSGGTQSVPLNPLDLDEKRYLVAPHGNLEWVRNLRAVGDAELRVGKRVDDFAATERPDAEKAPVLRAYLERWGSTTKSQFGVDASASEGELVRIAPGYPVFRLSRRGSRSQDFRRGGVAERGADRRWAQWKLVRLRDDPWRRQVAYHRTAGFS